MSLTTLRDPVESVNPVDYSDAGIVGLAHVIRQVPTAELADMATLLIELPQPLATQARPRLRLTLWELRRRALETGRAA